jgi:serine/threonine protein kinase
MENSVIDDRYQLIADIGSGGEARVFHARDMTTEQDVAIRLALRHGPLVMIDQPPESHEGWVRLLGSGSDPEYGAYQIFELLIGQTLGQMIPSGPLNVDDWRLFVDQSLETVEALHGSGWIHGDLNADNFFRAEPRWKLLELPFLRFDPPAERSTIFGSIHTLAPEQFDGKPPNICSDVYSLGCLYYYAASGAYPHPGATSQEVAIHCVLHPPDPLREKAPKLPAAWADWVMQLLARRPEDRIPDMAAARQLLGVA